MDPQEPNPTQEPKDSEFDPTLHTAEYVAIAPDESFAQIREKIEDALRRTPNVILVIPRGSQAFHTTQDFLALGKLQWRREVRVAVATPDPTIAGLARVLGFHIVEPPADHPALAGDPSFDRGTDPDEGDSAIEKPTAPLNLGGSPATPDWVLSPSIPTYAPVPITKPSTSGSLTTSTWLNIPGDGMGAHSTPAAVAPKPTSRSGQPPPRKRPRQTGQLLPTQIPDLAPAQTSAPQPEEAKARIAVIQGKAYRSGRGWRYGGGLRQVRLGRIVAVFTVLLALLLVAASGYAYVYLPEGTISVIPQSKTITDLPVRITVSTGQVSGLNISDPQPAQNVVSAQSLVAAQIQVPLSASSTVSTTGTRQIPIGRAQGTMHFVNTTTQPQTVSQSTSFKSADGITVQTTQAGTVPATNFTAQQFGALDIPIIATVEGPDGNLAANKIQGTYKGVLTYYNTSMQGGSIQTLKVVAQSDIDRLVTDLTSRLEGQRDSAIQDQVAAGQTLITETRQFVLNPPQSDHKAGEDASSATVTISGLATAYSYDQQKMQESFRQAVYDYVQPNEPSNFGPVTDPASIAFSPPTLVSADGEHGILEYGTAASAHVKYALTPVLAAQIRDKVKGLTIFQAQSLIAQQYGAYIAPASVTAKVLWFNLDKLPTDPTHIVVTQDSQH